MNPIFTLSKVSHLYIAQQPCCCKITFLPGCVPDTDLSLLKSLLGYIYLSALGKSFSFPFPTFPSIQYKRFIAPNNQFALLPFVDDARPQRYKAPLNRTYHQHFISTMCFISCSSCLACRVMSYRRRRWYFGLRYP